MTDPERITPSPPPSAVSDFGPSHSLRISGFGFRASAIVCAILLAIFTAVSYSAVLTKNATIDEPAHALSGWLDLRRGDFRFETVNPSLWKMWAALGNLASTPKMTFDGPVWRDLTWDPQAEVLWASRTLYSTPGNDADGFINHARAMMLALAVATGALLAVCAYRLAGPVAAIIATALFCFDPTVLAHAPLVKSDVAFALVLFALAAATWSLGRKATVRKILLVGLLCGIELNVKFSGVIVGPILAIMLAIRALVPAEWDGFRAGRSRLGRLGIAAVSGLVAIGMCFGVTWASYGFRFRVAPSESVRMDLETILQRARRAEAAVALHRAPTPAEIAGWPMGPTEKAVMFADQHHLLPEAMLAGLLYQHVCVQEWPGYLDGAYYRTGRWDYFPKALIYKTPLAELAAGAIAAVILIMRCRRLRRHLWTATCIAAPAGVFAAAALTTHLNIGLRNLLPLYPFGFLCIGIAAAAAWNRRPRLTTMVTVALAIGVISADASAYPNYLPFFNSAFAGEFNGLNRLTDSNLDWGQDVRLLAGWQKLHPDTPLYFDLFTTVNPNYYGIRAKPLPTTGHGDPPGVVAIGATVLKGVYLSDPAEAEAVHRVASQPPIDSLGGGTIYLFPYPGS